MASNWTSVMPKPRQRQQRAEREARELRRARIASHAGPGLTRAGAGGGDGFGARFFFLGIVVFDLSAPRAERAGLARPAHGGRDEVPPRLEGHPAADDVAPVAGGDAVRLRVA